MQVRLVNPANPFTRYAANASLAANGHRRRRRNKKSANGTRVIVVRTRSTHRRRHRNPLIVPGSISNPLILPNRRRRRHGRRNPDMGSFLETAGMGAAGAGASYVLNKYVISNLGTDASGNDTSNGMWIRALARFAGGGLMAWYMPGKFGAAFNGAMLYPFFSELDQYMQAPAAGAGAPTSAYLTDASLEDVLDGL